MSRRDPNKAVLPDSGGEPARCHIALPGDSGRRRLLEGLVEQFLALASPLEKGDIIHVLVDARTGAAFCECHIFARSLVALGTIDVPLDPDEQGEYRANREIVADHVAFKAMKQDAKLRRMFSNIVVEFTTEFDPDHPLKVIGGQHRFEAIREASEQNVNELHGLKVYFGLTSEQRLDVQLISNTVIAVPRDLYDRMQETVKGPELRDWCQRVGLLSPGEDFADKRRRGERMTVRDARTFIMNFYDGCRLAASDFGSADTTPRLCETGAEDDDWAKLRADPNVWEDVDLEDAGREYGLLVKAQRDAIDGSKRASVDAQEKASNIAILAAWAFVAGLLTENRTRQRRHYDLRKQTGRDPLNAAALAKARHRSDPENYRGLGTRTEPRERGRLVELFHLQAENGGGISKPLVELAMAQFHAKLANLEVERARHRVTADD